MAGSYRVRYKRGDIEVEVESTDKNYVAQKLEELLNLRTGAPTPVKQAKPKPSSQPATPSPATADEELDVAVLVTAIHEDPNFDSIEKHILEKRSIDARVLLCFEFAHRVGYLQMSTGDVERVTDELGVKIEAPNVAKAIRNRLKKYLSAGRARKKGIKTPYKINRAGRNAFEKILRGESL